MACAKMKARIVEEVTDGVTGKGELAVGRMGFASAAPAVVIEMIPSVVETTLDLVVRIGGPEIKALAEAGHDVIRKFVSQKTLEFLDGLIVGLEDVKSSEPAR